MNDKEKRDLYDALESNEIIEETEKHKMLTGGYRIDIKYNFGKNTLIHSQYSIPSKITPLGQFCVFYNGKPFGNWNETFGIKNKYVYDLYCAIINKINGKPFINPYKMNYGEIFESVLYENQHRIFPSNTNADKRWAVIDELKYLFLKFMDLDRTK